MHEMHAAQMDNVRTFLGQLQQLLCAIYSESYLGLSTLLPGSEA
jgi:hypothetical protein